MNTEIKKEAQRIRDMFGDRAIKHVEEMIKEYNQVYKQIRYSSESHIVFAITKIDDYTAILTELKQPN